MYVYFQITDIFGNANGIAKCIITQVNGSVKKVTNDLDQLIHELEALNVPEKVIQQIEGDTCLLSVFYELNLRFEKRG